MAEQQTGQARLLDDAQNAPHVTRVLAVVLLAGSIIAALQVALPDRTHVNEVGLYSIGAVAFALAVSGFVWARHARPWVPHAIFAAGTALICLGVYFSGVATGTYAVLFVWLVVMGASYFSDRAMVAHVLWILLGTAISLTAVESPGVSALVRWVFGGLLLIVAALMMRRIIGGRRVVEARLRREIAERVRLQEELEHMAHHDPLTGLPNRRRFEQELARELAGAGRRAAPLSLVALDLDEFKEYNDAHGHVAGDRLLKTLASAWSEELRAVDIIARLGGDEFVAILPGCPYEEAERVVERLRVRAPYGITCSAGTALWDGRESAEELVSRADGAMYAAKRVAGSPGVVSRRG